MEYWNYGILECRKFGILELLGLKNVEFWNFGIVRLTKVGILEILELLAPKTNWNFGFLDLLAPKMLESESLGA